MKRVKSVLLFPFQAFSTVVTAVDEPNADAASSDQVDDIIQYPFSLLSSLTFVNHRINEPVFSKFSFMFADN